MDYFPSGLGDTWDYIGFEGGTDEDDFNWEVTTSTTSRGADQSRLVTNFVITTDFPVSIVDYSYGKEPEDPTTIHMERFPHVSGQGLTPRDQFRLGRYELLSTSFETIERSIREQLAGMLTKGGFDPARDIEAITVNRWAHGYAYFANPLFDPYYEDPDDERYPHVRGRKRFGRIAIANSDAAASAMLEAAVEQGHRAASELI